MSISRIAVSSQLLAVVFAASVGPLLPNTTLSAAPPVDFNRDVRPILSDYCFKCHGPDESQREADLRLDMKEGLFRVVDGPAIVVPGQPEQSELWRRVQSADDDLRMPPPDSGRTLDQRQIQTLRAWIEQGASWQQHWAFVAPQRPGLPEVAAERWPANPIDYFVLARLEREGLSPSAAADRQTLIRRVTLDLTGLPPTPREVAAFLADDTPHAYGRLVERLLSSPRHGERMANVWLDAARYADTSGYQNDGPRFMWRWRDWVIDAYNQGLPFDQFTVEQLAGDLLPAATLDQRIATGFNRNHRGNSEGGVIPEEFQVEYVVDRVETTGTVWLGLTIGCGRCHEHKFDPLSQQEFYQFYAYFNHLPEYGRAIKEGNSPPFIKAPTRAQQLELRLLDEQLAVAQRQFSQLQPELQQAQEAWEQTEAAETSRDGDGFLARGLIAHVTFDDEQPASHQPSAPPPDRSRQRTTTAPFRDGDPAFLPGKLGRAGQFDGRRFVDAGDLADFGYFDKFSCTAWIRPAGSSGGTIVSRMNDVAQGDGYSVELRDGRIHVNLVKRWLDDCIRVETTDSVQPDKWWHLIVTYDGSRVADGIAVYINGQPAKLKTNLDFINQSFAAQQPLRIGGGGGPQGRFHGLIDDVRVYDRRLDPEESAMLAVSESVEEILATAATKRTAGQSLKLRSYFLAHRAPAQLRQTFVKLQELRRQRERLVEKFSTVMVMEEMPAPRPTFVLMRGEYDKPGERVQPGVPKIFPPLPENAANDRLGLARWLVQGSHPLTARVAVNRYWQMYFGVGLVKTAEDFGSQGQQPSHPDLLDWLATEFVRTGWNVKAMQRLIVTSATYRQSSGVTAELLAKDPENRRLARGPRFRLPAEMVRDQALAAGGLLSGQIGGPSVKPYQPSDLWKDIATDSEYVQDHGAQLYRRSMYTFWKRTVVPPSMATFDGSGREMCRVRPRRTNTPLQALTLMNDVTFVEAARVLAQRVLQEAEPTVDERLELAIQLILGRAASAQELGILRAGLDEHLREYRHSQEAADHLIGVGEYPLDDQLDSAEVAAYTAITSLLLNLDEAVTKQ